MMDFTHCPRDETQSIRLTVIVPFYNAGHTLERCVASILSQQHANFELLLIDDGSADGSSHLADSFARRDPRVIVLHTDNRGPSEARNLGLVFARGEYIQFVDADDCLITDAFRAIDSELGADTPDLVVYSAKILDDLGSVRGELRVHSPGDYQPETLLSTLTPALKPALLHYVWNKWYRTSTLRQCEAMFPTGERLGEDFVFNCDYLAGCRTVRVIGNPLYCYHRRRAGSLSRAWQQDEVERRIRMDRRLVSLYQQFGLLEDSERRVDALVSEMCLDTIRSVAVARRGASWRERRDQMRALLDSGYETKIASYAQSEWCGLSRRLECALLVRRRYGIYRTGVALLECCKALLSWVRTWFTGRRGRTPECEVSVGPGDCNNGEA